MTFAYAVNGFTLVCERPLPFLVPAPEGRTPDIELRFAPVPEADAGIEHYRVLGPRCVDLFRPGALRVRVEAGCRMIVDPAEGVTAGEIHTYVFGPAFAALLYQRGRMPLHAAAVRLGPGEAVAIGGASGAGKSTTTRALLRAGHTLLCDDQIAVDPQTGMAPAGFPATKLWDSALAHFGETPGDAPLVVKGMNKYHVAVPGAFATSAARLRALCILAPEDDVPVPTLTRLSVPEAVVALGYMAHHSYLAAAMGQKAAVFRACAALAGCIPIYLLRRPVDLGQIDAVVERVLEAAGYGNPVGASGSGGWRAMAAAS